MWNRVEFGEIVCLDKRGRPQFNDLLFHRGEPCFFAFDLLMSDGMLLYLQTIQHPLECGPQLGKVVVRRNEDQIK